MKTLEIFRGLYTELKRFNDNTERQMQINEKKEAEKRNPLADINDADFLVLKQWLRERLATKGIEVETHAWRNTFWRQEVLKFFDLRSESCWDYAIPKKAIPAALGYDNFSSLVADWRRGAKAGAA